MNIVITSEEQLTKRFVEAMHILENMRKNQKLWEANYGVEAKKRKKLWEEKADKFIEDIGTPILKTKIQS